MRHIRLWFALLLLPALTCGSLLYDEDSPIPALVESYPLGVSGNVSSAAPTPTMAIDFSKPPQTSAPLVKTNYRSEVGDYNFSINGNPMTGTTAGTVGLTDGTYPVLTDSGWTFDGTDDGLFSTLSNTPSGNGDFTVVVVLNTNSDDSGLIAGSFDEATSEVGWALATQATRMVAMMVSKDAGGPGSTSISIDGGITDRIQVFSASYDYQTDGTSVLILCSDGECVSDSSAYGPIAAASGQVNRLGQGTNPGLLIQGGTYYHYAYLAGTAYTEAQQRALYATYHSSGTLDATTGSWTSSINFGQAVAATITDNNGNTWTKESVPVAVAGGTALSKQGYAWSFDGGDDVVKLNAASPTGSFSAMIVFTMHSSNGVGNHNLVMGQYNDASTFRWIANAYSNAGVMQVGMYNGVADTYTTCSNTWALNRQSVLIFAADDAANTVDVWLDGVKTTGVAQSLPVAPGSDWISVGGRKDAEPTVAFDGTIHHFAYWDGTVLTAAQAATLRNTWLGTLSTKGAAVSTTSATPPAAMLAPPGSGTEPFFVGLPGSTSQVGSPATGSGGLFSASAITSLAQRGSFETHVVDDASGWSEQAVAGDGTAAITIDETTIAHGGHSFKVVLTGTTSYAGVISADCIVTGIGADIYLTTAARKHSGTADFVVGIAEYKDGACTTYSRISEISRSDLTTAWANKGGLFTAASWEGTTTGYLIVIREFGDGGVTSYFDAVQLRSASTPTDALCVTDADASAVCTAVATTIASPISATGPTTISGVFNFSYDPAVAQKKIWSDGAFNAANTYTGYISNMSEPALWTSDSGGSAAYAAPNVLNASANTDYTIRWKWSGGGTDFSVYWNGAWRGYTAGGGTGIRNAAQTTFNVGSDGVTPTPGDVWTRDLLFYRRMMP